MSFFDQIGISKRRSAYVWCCKFSKWHMAGEDRKGRTVVLKEYPLLKDLKYSPGTLPKVFGRKGFNAELLSKLTRGGVVQAFLRGDNSVYAIWWIYTKTAIQTGPLEGKVGLLPENPSDLIALEYFSVQTQAEIDADSVYVAQGGGADKLKFAPLEQIHQFSLDRAGMHDRKFGRD